MTEKTNLFRWSAAMLPMLAIAACTAIPAPDTPTPAPAPAVVPEPLPPAPPPAKPWDERKLDGGAWHYDASARAARFTAAGSGNALVSMVCAGGQIRLTAGLGGPGPLDVSLRTSAGTDRLRFEDDAATIPARDARLDRIAFSRGRFALEASNGSTLTLPVQSEIGRVIEDCR